MGLDISTKNDYARFNWTGATNFIEWNREHLKVDPFPSWQGSNGEIVVFNQEPESENEVRGCVKDVERWLSAFENYVREVEGENILQNGTGFLLGELSFRSFEVGVKDTCEKHELKDYEKDFARRKPELIEWEYLQAIKWYFVLKDGLKHGFIIYG